MTVSMTIYTIQNTLFYCVHLWFLSCGLEGTSAPTSPAHQVFFRRGLENVMPGDQVELKQKKVHT